MNGGIYMDEVTQVKNQYRMEQWTQLIKECQFSGLPVKTWCTQNDVRESSYYYWLKKLRKDAYQQQLPTTQKDIPKPVEFAKVQVNTPRPIHQAAMIIHLPFATIEVIEGTSQKTVEAVLAALKNIC